jgi:TrmH family RNA methyltransferase
MKFISSSNNTLIREVKSLKVKKNRQSKGLFFVEGVRIIEEALVSNAQVKNIFISDETTSVENDIRDENYTRDRKGMRVEEYIKKMKNDRMAAILSTADYHGCEICAIPERLFREISDTETPQGILAVVKMNNYSLKDIISNSLIHGIVKNKGNIVVLDGIQDPGNMGTIIRTADAAGFSGIIVSKGCVDPYNPKVLRSTMGSIFHIPTYSCTNLIETLVEIKNNDIRVYAAHLEGSRNYYNVDMTGNVAIVIGNEANGISSEAASMADEFIKIPMPGRVESLNASVAAGILMYEPLRQKINEL